MGKWFLVQHTEDNTRITNTRTSLIDLTFSDINFFHCAGVLNLNIRDHLPIFIIKKKTKENKEFTYVMGRKYRGLDMLQFITHLRRIDSEFIFSTNEKLHKLYTHYMLVLVAHCRKMKLRVRVNRPQFLNDELIQLMRERDLAFRVARRSGRPHDEVGSPNQTI